MSSIANASRLAVLAPEIVDEIAQSLPKPDLLALKSTCRELRHKSFHQFATSYFYSKKVALIPQSLKLLNELADSELAPYLRKLTIGLDHFTEGGYYDENNFYQRSSFEEEAFKRNYHDLTNPEMLQNDIRLLSQALSKLTSLEDVVLGGYEKAVEYHLPSLPDTIGFPLLSRDVSQWGVWWFLQATETKEEENYNSIHTRIFDAVMPLILNKASCDELTLHVPYGEKEARSMLDLAGPNDVQSSEFLENLRRLTLVFRRHSQYFMPDWSNDWMGCARLAKNVQDLNVIGGGFFCRLKSLPDLPYLRSVTLGSFNIKEDALCNFLENHSDHIRMLKITRVNLLDGSWYNIFKTLRRLPKLEDMEISRIGERYRNVFFEEQDDTLPEQQSLGIAHGDEIKMSGDEIGPKLLEMENSHRREGWYSNMFW
ncbi:hypothetical protein K402DRAFT_243541 [Aulographum hederae CBS 113979]|uniref:F-box domain-containing protein n=1 Tax=Aulographum hederae CBS 113979 TaxID=1176131 RepID=A0A6G1HA40_9PEZI|nr:hypothetical protein K402DRAFT_243541 [Aulographum hederae CBS 113979]